ncbi:ATP-binding protein [Micrococcus luteus]|uniref:AlbA family DNA-binding domain-containing protein n=1 Tax=Micrococcus luteus TaxID=1270 RepID=UPI00203A3E27|nr:ATP-binding protein [Micrococcus luteus]MCM3578401.1 ATP-binding protein [Micrococcus luteus]
MFTPIHRALGLAPGEFNRPLIEEAVAGRVAEGTDLDWKEKASPLKAEPDKEEFAKDVAAMANSGGGWIIYGVAEDQGDTNTASKATPVAWGTAQEQKFRQVAYALVSPPVVGLEFHAMSWGEEGHVVGMRVPSSLDVPHFASFKQDGFRAPRRDGAHTQYMDARQIEDAFRRRFQGRSDQRRTLDEAYETALAAAPVSQGVCLVVAAVPVVPGTAESPLSVDEALTAGRHADAEGLVRRGATNNMRSAWDWGDARKGLRGWNVVVPPAVNYSFGKWLGDDGSVRAYYRLGGMDWGTHNSYRELNDQPGHCLSAHVEWGLVDVAAMTRTLAEWRGAQDGYQVRIGLEWDRAPMAVRTTQYGDFLLPEDYSIPIHRFLPVRVEYDPLGPLEEWLPVLRQAAEDVVNQGGVEHLRVLADPERS